MEKMTYVVALNSAINCGALSPEVVEKLTALRDAQMKKSSAIHKPTAKQNENEVYKADILATMVNGCSYTVGELMELVPSIKENGLTNQRVSALLRQLKDCGDVVRTPIKNVAYFSKAEG